MRAAMIQRGSSSNRLSSSNRPFGVSSMMSGADIGYVGGSMILRWYRPAKTSQPSQTGLHCNMNMVMMVRSRN
jgi:hypothetical protein